VELKQIKTYCHSFWHDETGATAIEYAILAGLLSVGLIVSLGVLGNEISNDMDLLGNTIGRQDLNTGYVD
jgi:pilus assembly protein Flp/PilA